jgi:RNA polymerase-binding transcription factor DksA
MRLQIFAAALLLSLATSLNGNEPVSMAVSPLQSFAPANLTIRLRVEPDAANRTLEVVAESGEYYRSSSIQPTAPTRLALERGDYGCCTDCNEKISHKRLTALPFASRCRECEGLREISERVRRFSGRADDSLLVYEGRLQRVASHNGEWIWDL